MKIISRNSTKTRNGISYEALYLKYGKPLLFHNCNVENPNTPPSLLLRLKLWARRDKLSKNNNWNSNPRRPQ